MSLTSSKPLVALAIVLVLTAAACGSDSGSDDVSASEADEPPADTSGDGSDTTGVTEDAPGEGVVGVPTVVGVSVTADGGDAYSFDVTISSPYDGPDQYADAWRVVGADGEVYGVRELTHHHAGEQPFTRSLSGVAIPAGTTTVWAEARDLVDGWTGELFEVSLER